MSPSFTFCRSTCCPWLPNTCYLWKRLDNSKNTLHQKFYRHCSFAIFVLIRVFIFVKNKKNWSIPSPVTSICGKTDRYILVLNYCAFQQVSILRNFQIFLPAKQYTILQIFVYVYALLERCTITKPILICIYSMMWYILRFFFNIQIVNIQTLNIHTPILKKQNKQY